MFVSMFVCGLSLIADAKPPKWFSKTVAGYALEYDESHLPTGIYDKQRGFYVFRSTECDGGFLSLTLTRDRKLVSKEGYKVPSLGSDSEGRTQLKERPLSSLETDHHVKIGDSESLVRSRLGKPNSVRTEGDRKQFHVFEYVWKTREEEKVIYTQTYTFKRGKLIQIAFVRDMT